MNTGSYKSKSTSSKQSSYKVASDFGELTYGFEFEFVGMSDQGSLDAFSMELSRQCIPYVFTGKYGKNDSKAWVLGSDGSVCDADTRKELGGKFGFELVSPVLYAKDFPVLFNVLKAVKSCLKGYTNKTCGAHVHVGSLSFMRRGESYGNEPFTRGNCAVWLFSKTQGLLWNHLAEETRANNRFCAKYEDGDFESNKYLALSGSGFMPYCKHPTMECRLHQGTLEAEEITDWALAVAHFLWFCFHENPEVSIKQNADQREIAISLLEQFGIKGELKARLEQRLYARLKD